MIYVKRLAKYLYSNKGYFLWAVTAMLIGIGLDMFNPRLLRTIIDQVIIGGQTSLFTATLLALGGITLGRALLGYLKEYLFDFGSQKVVCALRQDLFDHLQGLSFRFFDGINTGELMSRIKEDIDNIWRVIAFGMMLFIEQCIYFVVAAALLFTLSWKLALAALALMPLIAWIAFRLEKEIGAVFDQISDQGVIINTTAQENLAGARLVKAFAREKHEIAKFLAQNEANYRLNMEQARIWGKHFPRVEFITNLVIVLVTTAGGFLVVKNEISLGTLVAFSNYVLMLIWPMRMIGWLTNMLAQALASSKKIEELFREEPDIREAPAPVRPAEFSGRITFENVSFSYHGVEILKDISFDVKPGTTLAIMGMTGSGKTSILNLIGRYYDCSAGRILLDGVDQRDLPLGLLRRQISLVMQDTFLFSDTIEENIKFGNEGATPEQLTAAAADARILDFIAELPAGLQTVIGERGIGLSGGQKQRIALARALLRQSPLLILDDATSNLDMETEHEVQRALEKRRGVTKLIVAHRISAVKNAAEILIVENGTIVERGNHWQLLARRERYYEIFREQFQNLYPDEEGMLAPCRSTT